MVEVLGFVVGDLLAIHRESLGEIAIAIKETHSGHVDAAVAGFFNIVTGKNSQTARVNLQSVTQSILHTEIGHRGELVAHGLVHIFLEMLINGVDFCYQLGVFAKLF